MNAGLTIREALAETRLLVIALGGIHCTPEEKLLPAASDPSF